MYERIGLDSQFKLVKSLRRNTVYFEIFQGVLANLARACQAITKSTAVVLYPNSTPPVLNSLGEWVSQSHFRMKL